LPRLPETVTSLPIHDPMERAAAGLPSRALSGAGRFSPSKNHSSGNGLTSPARATPRDLAQLATTAPTHAVLVFHFLSMATLRCCPLAVDSIQKWGCAQFAARAGVFQREALGPTHFNNRKWRPECGKGRRRSVPGPGAAGTSPARARTERCSVPMLLA